MGAVGAIGAALLGIWGAQGVPGRPGGLLLGSLGLQGVLVQSETKKTTNEMGNKNKKHSPPGPLYAGVRNKGLLLGCLGFQGVLVQSETRKTEQMKWGTKTKMTFRNTKNTKLNK